LDENIALSRPLHKDRHAGEIERRTTAGKSMANRQSHHQLYELTVLWFCRLVSGRQRGSFLPGKVTKIVRIAVR